MSSGSFRLNAAPVARQPATLAHPGLRRVARGGAAAGWAPGDDQQRADGLGPASRGNYGPAYGLASETLGPAGAPAAGRADGQLRGASRAINGSDSPRGRDSEESRLMSDLRGLDAKMKLLAQVGPPLLFLFGWNLWTPSAARHA